VTDNVVIAYEIGLRKLFTDYLDDVSTTYVDQATLLAARGPDAVKMAYRGGELKSGQPYPAAGTMRAITRRKMVLHLRHTGDYWNTEPGRVEVAPGNTDGGKPCTIVRKKCINNAATNQFGHSVIILRRRISWSAVCL